MLNEKILKLRKKLGYSQEELGNLLNVTRQTISNWELNGASPNPEQLKLLSKVLNVSIDELLDNDIQNILESKIINTENLTKKHLKISKVIIITLYFLILFALIFLTIYFLKIKNYYQDEYVCKLDNKTIYVSLTQEEDKSFLIEAYFEEKNKSEGNTETYYAGRDLETVFKSLNTLKKYIITHGGKCK